MGSSNGGILSYKRVLILILFLILVSPIFGVFLADMIGYHEPLDVAAEILGLKDLTEKSNWTPFIGYTVPGLPLEIGYVVAGFIGVGIILGVGFIADRFIKRRHN